MPNTSYLKALDHREWALVFVIEDIPVAFTNHPDLVGTEMFEDGRQVVSGLVAPNYSMGIDVLADWMLERSTVEIKIEDLEDQVLNIFRGFDGTEVPLVVSIVPTDDPIADASLYDRHVGTEYIGPAGERNYYPLIPGVTHARTHIGDDISAADFGAAPVSEHPAILEGRRCMIYRLFRDHVTYPSKDAGFVAWRPMSEADRMWWGTIKKIGHDINGRTWSISCDGPESWIYTRLGSLSQSNEVSATPISILPEEYNYISLELRSQVVGESDLERYGSASTNYTGPLTTNDLRSELQSLLATALADVGPDGVFEDNYNQKASMVLGVSDIRVRIRNFDYPTESVRYAVVIVEAHERVWLTLGYSPRVQRELPLDDELYVSFYEDPANAGTFFATFTTLALASEQDLLSNASLWDNQGATRVWQPLYPSGTAVLPHDPGNEEIYLELGYDGYVSHTGQFDQPVASDPSDPEIGIIVTDSDQSADTQGLWLFYGKRRFEGSDEIFDEYQVARCAWRRAGLSLAGVAGDPPRIRIVKWEDPRAFGFDRSKLTSPWESVANDNELGLKAKPLLRVGYGNPDQSGEDAHVLLQRLMLTTGTSTGWSSFSDDPTAALTDTDNEPTGIAGEPNYDAEIDDLGLSIPQSMVAAPKYWVGLTEALPAEGIRKAGISFVPWVETETIFRSIMAPRGWALGLNGGQYTPFLYDAVPNLFQISDDTVLYQPVQLNLVAKRTDNKLSLHRIKQTAKAIASKQIYTIEFNGNPLSGALQNKVSMRSPSPAALYQPYPNDQGKALGTRRQGAAENKVEAPYQRLDGGWVSRARDLVGWADRGHYWLHDYPLMDREADSIWPGTRVVITDPQPADPINGTYGITAANGIVTKINVTGGGRDVSCTILVDGRSTQIARIHAPSARGRGYDASTRRIYVDDDWLVAANGHDSSMFVEPDVYSFGGDAIIQVFQWDGYEWAITATGTVEAVDTTLGSGYIQLVAPGLNGTYRRDDEAVVVFAPYTDQDAPWVLTLFAPVSDQDGAWTDGTVVPWN